MNAFSLIRPAAEPSPVIVEVPHAGVSIPEPVAVEMNADPAAILRDSDIYVDRLFEGAPTAGATLLTTHVSRYVVDLNRAPDDVDRATVPDHPAPRGIRPRGVVWRTSTDGRSILAEPMNYAKYKRRIELFHAPYHAALRRVMNETRAHFGFAILLAGHSMPSRGRTVRGGPILTRADVVPGTQGRTTADAAVIDLVDKHFRDRGRSVAHDEPYRGGYTTQTYGRPTHGWHAIQVELSRALYVDETNGRPKTEAFDALRDELTELVAKLSALRL